MAALYLYSKPLQVKAGLLIACLLFRAVALQSQPEQLYTTDSAAVHRAGTMLVYPRASTRDMPAGQLPCSGIDILDVRYDTTLTAIYGKSTFLRSQFVLSKKINLQDGLAAGIAGLFNTTYAPHFSPGEPRVVIYIKQWMVRRKEPLSEQYSGGTNLVQLRLEAEAFLQVNERYYPAFQLDTMITASLRVKDKEIPQEITTGLFNPAIALLQQALSRIGTALLTQKMSYTESQLKERYYTQRFNLPILNTTVYKRGIYRTIDEFRNNQPSITECLIRENKNGATQFTDANGNDINPLKVFGYCDGKRLWIQRGPYGSPLVKVGNGFEYFVQLTNGTKLLQTLDMETAEAQE